MNRYLLATLLALAPACANAASTQVWASGTNGCITSTSLFTGTELNSIANGSTGTASANVNNVGGAVYGVVKFNYGGTVTPTTNAAIYVWFLKSIDGGSTYEDGSNTVTPPRAPDAVINVRVGTTITPVPISQVVPVPGLNFKVLIANQTGAAFPSSGNTATLCTMSVSQ